MRKRFLKIGTLLLAMTMLFSTAAFAAEETGEPEPPRSDFTK